jgi:hypothetical protein
VRHFVLLPKNAYHLYCRSFNRTEYSCILDILYRNALRAVGKEHKAEEMSYHGHASFYECFSLTNFHSNEARARACVAREGGIIRHSSKPYLLSSVHLYKICYLILRQWYRHSPQILVSMMWKKLQSRSHSENLQIHCSYKSTPCS